MANNVDPDEMARYEQSYLDLHCLHRNLCWSAGLKGITVHTCTQKKIRISFASQYI